VEVGSRVLSDAGERSQRGRDVGDWPMMLSSGAWRKRADPERYNFDDFEMELCLKEN
jgi:hypothetical protein